MNSVQIIGNLGADPKTGALNNGRKWANVRVATSKRYQSGNEWKTDTQWHNVVAYGNLAEHLGELGKGDKVFVAGELRTREYEKDGQKHAVTEILANLVYPIGAPQPAQAAGAGASAPPPEEDIPF